MKKYLPTILNVTIILVLVGGIFLMPEAALAQGKSDTSTAPQETSLITGITSWGINGLIASVANYVLSAVSWLLTISGTFLSISINLTTHIQEIFFASGSAASIQTVWIVIRDIASIFIIFSLLFYSIMTILGLGQSGLKSLIARIFIAGLLINFSLFFVKVAVDASNLVSLQFYNAIAPQTSTNFSATSAYYDGGLSNIFMQSLRIPAIYDKSALKNVDIIGSIGIATFAGIIMMVTAALSFLGAALAFTARTAIILFVMALSPLYFAGLIFPQIQKRVSDPLLELLKSQLIFMPVYLFLLYVSLRLISDPTFMKIFNSSPAGGGDGFLGSTMIGVVLQYAIALVFINAPLVAALALGAKGMKWVPDYKAVTGFFGRNTAGRAGAYLDKKLENTALGNSRVGRIIRAESTGKLATSTFGSATSWKDSEKLGKEIKKKGREIKNVKELQVAVAVGDSAAVRTLLSKMSDNEIASLDKDILTSEHVIPHLSSGVYKNVDKSEKSDADKVAINEARAKAVIDAIGTPTTPPASAKIKALTKNMSGEDLVPIVEAAAAANGGNVPLALIEHLKQGHLKDMEGLEDGLRHQIGQAINTWHIPAGGGVPATPNHAAYDHIQKNKAAWGVV